ncbi:MAG TPA: bifunctional glutamate--cysteine ligase GshA/glutathione synthetase GshB, partial [Bacillota bacterium]|nr:bifunctional glutamate--cysteine ligase GshA/glutathione synthetase GshB [Bacillota bacterium]
QLLIKEAERRGVAVELLDEDDNFIRLERNNKVEYVKQATRTSLDTYIASLIMENKEVTKEVLRRAGIRVPDGKRIRSVQEGLEAFEAWQGKPLVIKPKSTNFGQGISILKKVTFESYKKAVEFAFQYDRTVILEEFISGQEYRFLVIGDEAAAVLHRVPANVTGDGEHTVEALVRIKNQDPLRGKGYKTPLEKIALGPVEAEYLGAQGKSFQYVPDRGETVYLRENSNISTGGDSIDYTDEMNGLYKAIAVKAAQAVGAKICGADIIIPDIEKADREGYSVIELNFNPALHIHDLPFKGLNRHVEDKVLDLLGFK